MGNNEHLTERQVEREYEPVFRIKTLQTWRQLRKGPRFVRIGRRIFYPRTELERFIRENLVDTDSGSSA